MSRSTQTRRSISLKATTYGRIKSYVTERGGSISGFVEDTIIEHMGEPTEEDRQKFGEEVKAREKDIEAKKQAEEPDELEGYVKPILFL